MVKGERTFTKSSEKNARLGFHDNYGHHSQISNLYGDRARKFPMEGFTLVGEKAPTVTLPKTFMLKDEFRRPFTTKGRLS